MLNVEELAFTMKIPNARAELFLQPLITAMTEFEINTKPRIGMFLANLAHESGGLSVFAENLNYSAEALARVWPKRFKGEDGQPNGLAKTIARDPKTIANVVYADRMGNGSVSSGDGWKHRGRGPIQITGKANQGRIGAKLGVDLVSRPELLEEPLIGCRASAMFWADAGCNAFADKGDFDGVCDKINIGHKTEKTGDSIGFADRNAIWGRYKTFNKMV